MTIDRRIDGDREHDEDVGGVDRRPEGDRERGAVGTPYLPVRVEIHIDALARLRGEYPATAPRGNPSTWSARELAFVLNAVSAWEDITDDPRALTPVLITKETS